jgi:uncharacterized membrane protein
MHYAIPMAIVVLPVAVFFTFAGRGFLAFGRVQAVLCFLCALPLLFSATGHFASFSHPVLLVVLSGICEVSGAIGLLLRPTRRAASFCLVLLMIAVFPANIYAANRTVGGWPMPGVPVRTVMQVVYILMLLAAGWGLPRIRRPSGSTETAE